MSKVRLVVLSIITVTGSAATALADGSVSEGEKVFQRCASCHVIVGSDPKRKGPSLEALLGRPIASVAGYSYSPAMMVLGSSGAKWDQRTLDSFLKYPTEFVKGTKMTAPPVRRESERSDLIAYLSTL